MWIEHFFLTSVISDVMDALGSFSQELEVKDFVSTDHHCSLVKLLDPSEPQFSPL